MTPSSSSLPRSPWERICGRSASTAAEQPKYGFPRRAWEPEEVRPYFSLYELVSGVMDGEEVDRGGWVRLEFLTDGKNRVVDRPRRRDVFLDPVLPNVRQQHVAGDHLPFVRGKVLEDFEFLRRQFYLPLLFPGFLFRKVKLDVTERVFVDGLARFSLPAEQRADPGKEDLQAEGFRHIVVGSQFQPENLVDFLPPAGEHEDGSCDGVAPELPANIEAVFPGEHDIQNDQGNILAFRHEPALLSVRGAQDFETLTGERIDQAAQDGGIVFDHEYSPHVPAPPPSAGCFSGKKSVNSLPSPGVLFTSICPRCASTICLTRARPRPAPPAPISLAPSVW